MTLLTLKNYLRYCLVLCVQIGLFFRKNKNESTYVFHHLPKCGGTSLRKSLKELKNMYNDYRVGWGSLYPIKYPISRFGYKDCLAGHFELEGNFLFQRYPEIFDNRRFILFTFIRHPLSLAISYYYYRLKQGEKVDSDIRKHLQKTGNYLSKVLNVNSQNYKKILDRYDFIGIFEEYDESLAQLSTLLGIESLNEKNINKAKTNDLLNSITQEDIDQFEIQNDLDFVIYKYCLNRFKNKKCLT
ncbi:MAG: hypothetical protein ACI9WV_001773 [Patiriisocius sp.]|jgi:hypothetical protein